MAEIDPALRIRSVELGVSDLARSLDFYERVLGLPLIAQEEDAAQLGGDSGAPALVLRQIADPAPPTRGTTGLFHVAWLHPSRAALADSVRRVAAADWPLDGASDHGVSEALYLSDPDGLGVEIYADRPRERWPRPPDGRGVRMFTAPLDVEDLLAQSDDGSAAASTVGHVHLKVSDVQRASAFYRDVIGLREQAALPSAAFLSAGGYHHHIGLNSWESAGAARPAPDAPGVRRVDFQLSDAQAARALAEQLAHAGVEPKPAAPRDAITVRDPDGQLLAFTHS